MSKFGWFVLLAMLGFAFTVHAKSNEGVSAVLAVKTNLGAKKYFVLSVLKGEATLNGVALPDAVLVLKEDALSYVFSVVNSPVPRSCADGIYEHVVTRKGKTRRETGCVEERRFAELYSAYRELQR